MPVLIGSYADQISFFDDDFKPSAPPIRASSPSYLAASADGGVIYTVAELDEGHVAAFRLDGTPLGSLPTGGASPCHLAVAGGFVLSANYQGGSVSVFALDAGGGLASRTDLVQHTGSSVNPDRQSAPHAHQVTVRDSRDPRDSTVYVVDLGLDQIVHYRLTSSGVLERQRATSVTPLGSGPRHLVLHPDGRVFVANELTSTVAVLDRGFEILDVQPSVLVPPAGDNFPSELLLSADGTRLYVANRGNDTITTFAVTAGGLSPLDEVSTGGTWPRHFALLDGALAVANQHSDTVTLLELDPATGVPQPGRTVLEHPSPSMVLHLR
ncbi:lactonase family protein [Dactylosporangium sp. NPDC006015]|uniref:lactonase family protein n=1 Tax=Dactylosporangium sp. NPDC006015 TaxID=3154576 RepID=UPI0033AAB38A